MFESFFPRPKWLVISAILWAIFTVFVWYSFGDAIGGALGFEFAPDDLRQSSDLAISSLTNFYGSIYIS